MPKNVRPQTVLLNAVNHKDYSKGVLIQISVYDDKIYIWNDGKFPEMLSVENIYEKHSSIPYNPKVADVLFKAGMIESWGRGFDKIKEECENSNTPLPEYEISERGIMVLCKPGEKYLKLLKKYGVGAKMENEPQTKLLEIIAGNPSISKKEIAERLNVSPSTVKRLITALREQGKLDYEGSSRKGTWIIK